MRIRSLPELARDFVGFAQERKRRLLLPLFLVLLLAALFLFFASGSVASPFIYALF